MQSLPHLKIPEKPTVIIAYAKFSAIPGLLVALPSANREIKLKPAELNRFVGTYQAANGSSFSIENRAGKLYRIVPNGDPKELKAESKTKLFYTGVDRQIEFVFDRKGQVKQVFFIADGIKLELKKTK